MRSDRSLCEAQPCRAGTLWHVQLCSGCCWVLALLCACRACHLKILCLRFAQFNLNLKVVLWECFLYWEWKEGQRTIVHVTVSLGCHTESFVLPGWTEWVEKDISIYKSVSHFSPQKQLRKWLVRGGGEKCQVGTDLQIFYRSKWAGERKELRNLQISLGSGEGTLWNLGIWVLYLGCALCSGFEQLTPILCLLPCLWSKCCNKTMLYFWWKPHTGLN